MNHARPGQLGAWVFIEDEGETVEPTVDPFLWVFPRLNPVDDSDVVRTILNTEVIRLEEKGNLFR